MPNEVYVFFVRTQKEKSYTETVNGIVFHDVPTSSYRMPDGKERKPVSPSVQVSLRGFVPGKDARSIIQTAKWGHYLESYFPYSCECVGDAGRETFQGFSHLQRGMLQQTVIVFCMHPAESMINLWPSSPSSLSLFQLIDKRHLRIMKSKPKTCFHCVRAHPPLGFRVIHLGMDVDFFSVS